MCQLLLGFDTDPSWKKALCIHKLCSFFIDKVILSHVNCLTYHQTYSSKSIICLSFYQNPSIMQNTHSNIILAPPNFNITVSKWKVDNCLFFCLYLFTILVRNVWNMQIEAFFMYQQKRACLSICIHLLK